MARPLFWLGIPTTSTAVVVVRSDSNGTVTVNCNGSDFTATAATATDDGLVKISVTGLSADTPYSYTVTTPDGSGSATLKTYPTDGEAKIAFYSCNNGNNDQGFSAIEASNAHAVVCLGDFGYFAGGAAYNGETAATLGGGSTTLSEYHDNYRLRHRYARFRHMAERIPFAHIPDDHEWDINNVDWALVSASTDIVDTAIEGASDYIMGNLVNSDTTSDTLPFYFRFECGDTEVFVLSACVHGQDPTDSQRMVRDDQGVGNGCIGRDGNTYQETWLLAQLAASSKKYKLILSPKMTLESTNSNADSWNAYGTEMDRVLQAIHDNSSGWAVPGGVIFGSGDWHSPGIHASANGEGVKTYDHVNVTPAPMSGQINDSGAAQADITKHHYEGSNITSLTPWWKGIWGLAVSDEDRITLTIKNATNWNHAHAAVDAGELGLSTSEVIKFSI